MGFTTVAKEAVQINKVSAARYDVTIDWGCPSRNLGYDLIESSAWAVTGPDSALTLEAGSIAIDKRATTIWMEGGTLGAFYIITNTITTLEGRVLTGTFIVNIVAYNFLSPTSYCI